MTDHAMLMRAAVEHDISHVRLGHAVAFIEANMDPEQAAEAISLIHAAISPAHAVVRHRAAELAAIPEAGAPDVEVEAEPQTPPSEAKPKRTPKPRVKKEGPARRKGSGR